LVDAVKERRDRSLEMLMPLVTSVNDKPSSQNHALHDGDVDAPF
jgi:hypothetical protein